VSKRPDYLAGYVSIDSATADGSVVVLGKSWTRDYPTALELCGKTGGVVASRHWVAQKRGGEDPVTKHKLTEIPASASTKKGGRK
jgi:hypothetical protein